MPLKVAAKVAKPDEEYFATKIKPLFADWQIEQEFLGNAAALVFPVDWPEPLGS